MNPHILFDPNGLAARAQSTCSRSGAAFEVYDSAPFWAVLILRVGDFLIRLAGVAAIVSLIAFGLIAMVGK